MSTGVVYQILIGTAGSIIGVFLTWFFNVAKRSYYRKIPKIFWTGGTKKINLVYGSRKMSRNRDAKDTASNADKDIVRVVNAYSIGSSLSYLKDLFEVSVSLEDNLDTKDENLFLLGGPLANKVITEFVNILHPYYYFYNLEQDNRDITNKDNTSIFTSRFDNDGSIVYTVGWFIRAPNPLNKNKVITIAAGSYGHGTAAVVSYLMSNNNLRKLNVKRYERVEGIVAGEFKNGKLASPPELIASKRE